MDLIIAVLLLGLLMVLYLLPAIIATNKDHKQSTAIWVLTIFAGWTVIGWIAALVWAFVDN